MGWRARFPRLLAPGSTPGIVCFSMRAHVKYTSNSRSSTPRRMIEGYSHLSALSHPSEACEPAYIESIAIPHQRIMQQVPVDLSPQVRHKRPRVNHPPETPRRTCGLIRTKSMNSTTKSCSTYLSQKLPHLRHTVSRMLCPLDLSPAPEYEVHSVLTGCRHSMQMGIGARTRRVPGAVPGAMRGREARRVAAVPLVQGEWKVGGGGQGSEGRRYLIHRHMLVEISSDWRLPTRNIYQSRYL